MTIMKIHHPLVFADAAVVKASVSVTIAPRGVALGVTLVAAIVGAGATVTVVVVVVVVVEATEGVQVTMKV